MPVEVLSGPSEPFWSRYITAMSDTPLEPDSPEDDTLRSEIWTTDGGSHLEMLIDSRVWSQTDTDRAKDSFCKATDMTFDVASHSPSCIGGLLCDDARIAELNNAFRGKGSATNVLSFPEEDNMAGEHGLMSVGEIAIAAETVRREADAEAKVLIDHMTHLWVHGVLHLLGHDHEDDGDADLMEAAEISILAAMGIANPYEVPPADTAPVSEIVEQT